MNKTEYNVAIVGATGLVGRTMLRVLEERNFPIKNLKLLASEHSAGTIINYMGSGYIVGPAQEDSFVGMDVALFSAGKEASIKYAPAAMNSGCIVIDNGSYWRMNENVPLVVPEVNPEDLHKHHGIIANPNCSTIQLVAALKPIEARFGLKRIVISTYQSISGAGQKGINHLLAEINGKEPEVKVSCHKVAFNTVFHKISDGSGFSEEEIKMLNETRKILHQPSLKIAVTCVRLPLIGGHGESVNIETEKPFTLTEIRTALLNAPGLKLLDEPRDEVYPTPAQAGGTDDVYIGRLRADESAENGLYMWIVADNVRKGAATNAVQIAEALAQKNLMKFEPFTV